MKKGIILQARISSTRLHSKVLMNLPSGHSRQLLGEILFRCHQVKEIEEIVLATSVNVENDSIEQFATSNFPSVKVFRGSENDVLERFFFAAKKYQLQLIVRLTADNPFIDPNIIEFVIKEHLEKNADYTYSKNFPLGMNVEVFSFQTLEKIHKNANKALDKEHVTAYIHKNSSKFKIHNIYSVENLSHWRLTIDTPQDYSLACVVFDELKGIKPFFTLSDLKNLFKEKPYLLDINCNIQQKKVFPSIEEEIIEAIEILNSLDMIVAAKILKKHHTKKLENRIKIKLNEKI